MLSREDDNKKLFSAVFWFIVVFFIAPGAVGYAWEEWKQHSYLECTKDRECRKKREEAEKYIVYDEMPDSASQNYYRD